MRTTKKKFSFEPVERRFFLRTVACMAAERSLSSPFLMKALAPSDRRMLDQYADRFITQNQELLTFLGIQMRKQGTSKSCQLYYQTSNYIGAIPTLLPNGTQGGDIQVLPRFNTKKPDASQEQNDATQEEHKQQTQAQHAYANLIELLQLLEYAVAPEFYPSLPLKNSSELRPPLYMEAAKFVDLYDKAIRENWRKFRVAHRTYPYPKSGTVWNTYARQIANPKNMLVFPTRDNILSVDHPEWRQIKYAFTLAQQHLTQIDTPESLKYNYQYQLTTLAQRVQHITPEKTTHIPIHSSDPQSIQAIKQQANVLLSCQHTISCAWRIDVAKIFECYVQHVLSAAFSSIRGTARRNPKISGSGHIPRWGLQYLEPDFLFQTQNALVIADAKYKANLYAPKSSSSRSGYNFKEIFRHDLHQVLAYCSFAPQKNKLALLCYPSYAAVTVIPMYYQEPSFGVKNTVLIVGLPFDVTSLDTTIQTIQTEIVNHYL